MGLHKIFPQDNTGVADLAPFLVHEHGVEVHLVHVRAIDCELDDPKVGKWIYSGSFHNLLDESRSIQLDSPRVG